MPGQRVASLEIELAMATGGAVADVNRFGGVVDKVSAQAIRDLDQIDAAMKNVGGLDAPTAQLVKLADESARSAISMARDRNLIERSGEALVRQLDKEAAAIGRTKEEMRAAKVEAAALAAAQAGNTDLADRLLSSSRKRDQAAEAAAQARDKAVADELTRAAQERVVAEAAVNAKLMERARLEMALDRTMGTSRGPAKDNGATFSALAARAAEEEARATSMAAASAAQLAREHAQLVDKVRGSQAAMEADAAAAERMRAATDPLYVATKRLNAEIEESTRLYHSGATAPAEYARQQEVLTGRLRDVGQQTGTVGRGIGQAGETGKLAGHHMQNLAFQFQDLGIQMAAAAGSSAPFKMAMMALFQQGTQIQGIMSQAGIGIRGVGAAFGQMSKSILLATVSNPYLLAFAAAATAAAVAVKMLQKSANEDGSMKAYAASLGLSAKEIRNLDNVTVTYGDTAKAVFQVAGAAIWEKIGPAVKGVKSEMKEWLDWIASGAKTAVNFMIGAFVGGYNGISKTWGQLPAVMGDAFYSTVNVSIEAINAMVRKAVDGINTLIAGANTVLDKAGLHLPSIEAGQIAKVDNQFAGAGAKFGKTMTDEMTKATKVDYVGQIGDAITAQARKNAMKRIKDQATEKGYLDPEAAKTDKHAEALAREAEAIEAQIRNLYALADAYGISGAAALIAEARVKAESKAIKQRADIEAAVDREIRLAIAQRVSDGSKATAAMNEQAGAQERVNAMVKAGLVPAEQAADLVKNHIADLALLDAVQAAQERADAASKAGEVGRQAEMEEAVKRATAALNDQRDARVRLTNAETDARYNAATAAGSDRLAEMREEIRLIGATDIARARSMAELKARQEASTWKGLDPDKLESYVKQQGDIAAQGVTLAQAQDAYNDSLTATADKWDIIAGKVQSAGQGMADAFGPAGAAIGDLASIYAGFSANRARLDADHNAKMAKINGDQKAMAAEQARYALRTSGAQVQAFGDMASAAKGFFKEGSTGYRTLAAVEKVYRVAQMAMSIQAMVQNAAETFGFLTNSAAKSVAAGTEGIANQSKLPFPFNIAAMAATGAALVAAGIAVMGGGRGGAAAAPVTNTGTGTVLGAKSAQSESISRSIDALREVDLLTNTYSRQMAASLKSIESQIGGVASLVVRAGNVDASGNVKEGFKTDAIGSVLSKIPVIGGILGSLFGSKTTVIGNGLYGGAQTVGSINANGFDASYYSDVEKKKKLFGITTSTKTSTQYAGADAGLENQFTLILKSFSSAIAASAVPLGLATAEVQNRLNGFVVNIGKIDLKGLTGEQIEEKLSAVFGAAADGMANAAFPGLQQFQKVGEGTFETLIRVASTVEAVGTSLDMLSQSATGMGIAAKLGLADQFDSISDLTSAAEAYFQAYYSKEEQAAAKTAQLGKALGSMGLAMPASIAGFRQLVEAQDLTSAAGQSTYATLLKLAPAFADLQTAMDGARSAADVAAERQDLERKMLELRGDTAAIRALDLAKLDASNRGLQQQIWAVEDAQAAAKAAEQLRDAWKSVGDTIMNEVKRIRGLSDTAGGAGFASLMGQFNASTAAARAGDQDAAKNLPQLSKALLDAAALQATSRQELDRVQAQTAASLETTFNAISALAQVAAAPTPTAALIAAAAASQTGSAPAAANDDLKAEIRALREEVAGLRKDNNQGNADIAKNTESIDKRLDDITADHAGQAISIGNAA